MKPEENKNKTVFVEFQIWYYNVSASKTDKNFIMIVIIIIILKVLMDYTDLSINSFCCSSFSAILGEQYANQLLYIVWFFFRSQLRRIVKIKLISSYYAETIVSASYHRIKI